MYGGLLGLEIHMLIVILYVALWRVKFEYRFDFLKKIYVHIINKYKKKVWYSGQVRFKAEINHVIYEQMYIIVTNHDKYLLCHPILQLFVVTQEEIISLTSWNIDQCDFKKHCAMQKAMFSAKTNCSVQENILQCKKAMANGEKKRKAIVVDDT